ncbi:MAG: ApaG protein [Flammeovirgaceae bacterium]|jgi:ApaG protein
MVTQTTEGIKVSVETEYHPEYSASKGGHFVFTYRIHIENTSDYTIQLLRRHWHIYESDGTISEVEGEGVVGQQPVLEPGQVHSYVSGCNLQTGIGKMNGMYLMERGIDGKRFPVIIPDFSMVVPFRLN